MQEEHERPVGLPLPAFLFLPFGRLPLGPPQPCGVSLIKPTMAREATASGLARRRELPRATFYCGLWYSIWYTVPIAAFVVYWIFGVDDNEDALLISLPIAASIGIVRGFFRRKAIYERLPVGE